jgi:phosphoglucosamine mutase
MTLLPTSPPRLFGTDGIRGTANAVPMDAATVLGIGQALGQHFAVGAARGRRRAVIARDTRLSGEMLEAALTAGLVGVGVDVMLAGTLPTPALALLTRSLRADLGVMISAGHNPPDHNGIKVFGPGGEKLSDAEETAIEARLAGGLPAMPPAGPALLGRANRIEDAPGRYLEAAKAAFPRGRSLNGLRLVVDCANGAGWRVGPTVLRELGAEVVAMGVAPDGHNINAQDDELAPDRLGALVRERRADLGIAFDGDATRLLLTDEQGAHVNGDQILALLAAAWQREGRLTGGAVVATVMANAALATHLGTLGLGLLRTEVGDRQVVAGMRAAGCNLGGESSGNIVMGDVATTSDSLWAALAVLAVLVEEGRAASQLCHRFTPRPQATRSVPLASGRAAPLDDPAVRAALAEAEALLGPDGRVLLRASGTRPVLRVMTEGADAAKVQAAASQLAGVLAARIAEQPAVTA